MMNKKRLTLLAIAAFVLLFISAFAIFKVDDHKSRNLNSTPSDKTLRQGKNDTVDDFSGQSLIPTQAVPENAEGHTCIILGKTNLLKDSLDINVDAIMDIFEVVQDHMEQWNSANPDMKSDYLGISKNILRKFYDDINYYEVDIQYNQKNVKKGGLKIDIIDGKVTGIKIVNPNDTEDILR